MSVYDDVEYCLKSVLSDLLFGPKKGDLPAKDCNLRADTLEMLEKLPRGASLESFPQFTNLDPSSSLLEPMSFVEYEEKS